MEELVMCKEIKGSASVKLVTGKFQFLSVIQGVKHIYYFIWFYSVVNYAKLTPVRTDIASMVEHVKSLEQLQHVLANQVFLSDLILNDQIFLGYSGSNCQIDPCSHKPCLNDGKCSVVPDGASVKYECTCKQGYTGTDCQNTPCYNVNCQVLKSLSPVRRFFMFLT